MSTITGNVVNKVQENHPELEPHVVASALAIIAGAIICFIGFIRFGRIVDFISLAAISAFMTGSALNIAVGQVPALMGITGFSNRDSTYKVVINILKHLGRSKLDAAIGLTALLFLYLIRAACTISAKKVPQRAKFFFFLSTLRTAFIILLYTLIGWLVQRNHPKKHTFKILGKVPRGKILNIQWPPIGILTVMTGFKNAAVPTVTKPIIQTFASELPASVIVLLIEHIAIAKSFGRVNNYTIDPSQEMVAIGVTNLLGPFLGAYPATGSFSRTAIKSKAGVRTPFAGVITAIVVLLAIYALPAVFFYIPNAVLSAVIIHAVGDLITPPNTVYQFWRISPLEVIIFFAGVIVTIFSSIENGIYVTISVSAAILLFRVLFAKGRFLGKVKIHSVVGDHIIDNNNNYGTFDQTDPDKGARNIFLPLEHGDGSNPEINLETPYPGIFIYRFSEGYNYPNANHYLDHMVHTIFEQTRRTNQFSYPRLGDRPWNDPGPRRGHAAPDHSDRPTLKAVILDLSSVNNVDITSVQHLIDVRNQLDRYTSPKRVDWHFACINNRWTKRALTSAGFGYPNPDGPNSGEDFQPWQRWKPIFSVAEIGGAGSAASAAEIIENQRQRKRSAATGVPTYTTSGADDKIQSETVQRHSSTNSSSQDNEDDLEKSLTKTKAYAKQRVAVVHGVNRPLFHVDLTSALQSAVANVLRKEEEDREAAKVLGKGVDEV